jgi:transposase
MPIAAALQMTDDQRCELERIARCPSEPYRVVIRAMVLLDAADGVGNTEIQQRHGISRITVNQWRKRFTERGLERFGQVDKGRGPKTSITQATVAKVASLAGQKNNAGKSTHYSIRTAADATGVSRSTVQRVWSGRGLKPHRVASFKVSTDPDFEKKLVDVVGLYMDPPDNAVVISVDEKSQIQALDRTQPGLPIKPGRAGTMTHDYKRNGTTTLFAALDVLSGKVIGSCSARHRHQEFLGFLRQIDANVETSLDIHIVCDNYATHKHADVTGWLNAHPRFHIHFTPTSSSWLNLVERWFRDLDQQALKRGVFHSVPQLQGAIHAYINARNADPKPFTWTKTAEQIITKVRRARVAIPTKN